MSFHGDIQQHGGFYADTYTWSSRDPSPSCLVIFIPGNPGLPGYYFAMLEHLTTSLAGKTCVAAISQLGHTTVAPAQRQHLPSLDQQVSSKAAFVKEKQKQWPHLPTFVIAHSLGGWMTVEVTSFISPYPFFMRLTYRKQMMKHYPELKFESILLFPSLSNMVTTPNGKRLRWFLTATTALIVSRLCFLFALLPFPITAALVGLFTGHQGLARTVTTKLVSSPSVVWQSISLGPEELERITQPDLLTLEAQGQRVTCYWAKLDQDGWCNEPDTSAIKSAIERGGGKALRCVQGLPHDFCVDRANSKYMAELCAQWISHSLSQRSA